MSEVNKLQNEPNLTQDSVVEAFKLQETLVRCLWPKLTHNEREIYKQVVDDPHNTSMNNIITLAFAVGLETQLNHSINFVKTAVANSNRILSHKNEVIGKLSVLVLGLSAAVVGLLFYIIIF